MLYIYIYLTYQVSSIFIGIPADTAGEEEGKGGESDWEEKTSN